MRQANGQKENPHYLALSLEMRLRSVQAMMMPTDDVSGQ